MEDLLTPKQAQKVFNCSLAKVYKMALEAVAKGEDFAEEFFLCPVCGHIELGSPPENCPICNVKGEKFVQV